MGETCEQRIDEYLARELKDLRHLWSKHEDEDCKCGEGSRYDHGLAFDYVAAGTFKGQRKGYFRFQLSYGGPSDEFRFYADAAVKVHRIEYRFHDWFDGAGRDLSGSDYDLLLDIFDDFRELGAVEKALADSKA